MIDTEESDTFAEAETEAVERRRSSNGSPPLQSRTNLAKTGSKNLN